MKKIAFLLLLSLAGKSGFSQTSTTDSLPQGTVTVIKDNRLDVLAKKELAYNESLNSGLRSGKGYRLMLLSTNDRTVAMNLRSKLLQYYPDQKVYMTFQLPYIKVKFGNFPEKEEADRIKKEILKNKLVTSTIYVVQELIEIKPDPNKEKETP